MNLTILSFYSSTTFIHSSANSTKIGSCIATIMAFDGFLELWTSLMSFRRCGFLRRFFICSEWWSLSSCSMGTVSTVVKTWAIVGVVSSMIVYCLSLSFSSHSLSHCLDSLWALKQFAEQLKEVLEIYRVKLVNFCLIWLTIVIHILGICILPRYHIVCMFWSWWSS